MQRLYFHPPMLCTCFLLHSGWRRCAGVCLPTLVWFSSNLAVSYLLWRRGFIAGFTLLLFKVYAHTKSKRCVFVALIVKFWLCFSASVLLKVLVIPGSFRVFVFLVWSTFCLWSINLLSGSSNRIFSVVRRATCSFTATQESVSQVSGCVGNCKLQENRNIDL